ncbi:hypothetical protein Ancab_020378 [Ancistrocladus abbreviatus]
MASLDGFTCLLGGVAPLMPSIDVAQLKKPSPSDEKVTWLWLSCSNSAQKDYLQLYHWLRVVNGIPPGGNYPLANHLPNHANNAFPLWGENVSWSTIPADSVSPTNVQVTSATIAPPTSTADSPYTPASLRLLRVYLRTFALEQTGARSELISWSTDYQAGQTDFAGCLLQYKEAEGSSYRDGSYTDMPGMPKDCAFIPESLSFGGKRVGRRDQKRKGFTIYIFYIN